MKMKLQKEKWIGALFFVALMFWILFIEKVKGTEKILQDKYVAFSIVMLSIFVLVFMLGALFLLFTNIKLETLFLIIMPVVAVLYMLMLPPYTVPDENTHISKAYQMSNRYLGIKNVKSEEGVVMRKVDAEYNFNVYTSRELYNELLSQPLFVKDESDNANEISNLYEPQIVTTERYYVLSGLGIAIGRCIKLNTIPMLLLGRLFNVLLFIVSYYFSIRLMPFAKHMVFMIALLPITLQQAVSVSYDSMLISFSMLAIALTFHIAYSDVIKKRYVILYVFSLFMVCTCKSFAYFSFIFLPFIILYRKKSDYLTEKKESIKKVKKIVRLFIVSILILMILAICLIKFPYQPGDGNIISWSGTEGYSIAYLWNHPVAIISLLINTFIKMGDFYFTSAFAGPLGWLNIQVPAVICFSLFLLLLVGGICKSEGEGQISIIEKNIMLVVAVISFLCGLAGMTLGWTPLTEDYINGYQGRYMLPFLLLIFLALRRLKISVQMDVSRKLITGMFFIQIIIAYVVFSYCL